MLDPNSIDSRQIPRCLHAQMIELLARWILELSTHLQTSVIIARCFFAFHSEIRTPCLAKTKTSLHSMFQETHYSMSRFRCMHKKLAKVFAQPCAVQVPIVSTRINASASPYPYLSPHESANHTGETVPESQPLAPLLLPLIAFPDQENVSTCISNRCLMSPWAVFPGRSFLRR